MKEKTVSELKAMQDAGETFQLIDVREPHEFDICNLNGELIPLGEVVTESERIRRDIPSSFIAAVEPAAPPPSTNWKNVSATKIYTTSKAESLLTRKRLTTVSPLTSFFYASSVTGFHTAH